MRLVVADTGPLNYLVLIEQIELLPALFERVFVPEPVETILLAVPRLFKAPQESPIMFETAVEPVLFRFMPPPMWEWR